MLLALRFYATGAFLGNIAREENFLCSKRAVSESLHDVSYAIVKNLGSKYLRFPSSPEEKLEVKRGFFEMAGFPGCLGSYLRVNASNYDIIDSSNRCCDATP